MTNEEAIAVLEEQRNFNRSFQHCFESQVDDISAEKVVSSPLAADRYKRIADALDMAIYAIGEAERAFQDMVKSMPTCREPEWLPQGFGNAGYEQGGGGAGCSGDEKDFVFYIVGIPRDAGRGGSGKEI